jgi:N-acetylmuramoyl-L-alanine amidase
MNKLLSLLLTLLFSWNAVANNGQVQVEGARIWQAPDHTRLVFDISRPVDHNIFKLKKPERLVIDFTNCAVTPGFQADDIASKHLKGIRYASRAGNDLRVVLDLRQSMRPKTFELKPNAHYGHRLVVDLHDNPSGQPKIAKSVSDIKHRRDVVVAIDAGHGGEDPGAIGPTTGAREKRITLQIAKRIEKLINARPGMSAILTRTGDYYVGLRKRIQIARNHKADLFVSIHADAFRDKSVRGASVYVLSNRGASSEAARWLAERENAADLVGGVSLDDKDDMLASVLLDLSQAATQEASLSAADQVYRHLRKIGKVHGRQRVQRAGFLVLKSPDIPSLLIETGFISNPTEERKLRTPQYQQKMAAAILQGIERYFREAPPPDTLLAER